jgi:hypothetical protein
MSSGIIMSSLSAINCSSNGEIRRASDPVRTLDPNFSVLKKLQRFHSLNMMKPLPVPQSMKSLINKTGSNNTFHSSHSSIATDYSLAENDEYGSPGRTDADHEAALEEQLMVALKTYLSLDQPRSGFHFLEVLPFLEYCSVHRNYNIHLEIFACDFCLLDMI